MVALEIGGRESLGTRKYVLRVVAKTFTNTLKALFSKREREKQSESETE